MSKQNIPSKNNREKTLFEETVLNIEEKLNILISLKVMELAEGKTQKEAIRILANVGLRPYEIASILNVPAGNVRSQLSQIRKSQEEEVGE